MKVGRMMFASDGCAADRPNRVYVSMGSKIVLWLTAILLLAPAPAEASFPRLDAPLHTWKLFDLGVTDIDGDGRLDVYTVNHKFDASLLRNSRSGWVDVYDRVGLNPTPAFPGLETVRSAPLLSTPGLYFYASTRPEHGDPFHLRSVARSASGSISFAARRVSVEREGAASATVSPGPDNRLVLDFEISPGGSIDIFVDHQDLPLEVEVDEPFRPSEIKVGARAIASSTLQFEIRLRDRHGYGFADFDGDGRQDVLITSGGLGGGILDPFYAGRQTDELLLMREGALVDRSAESGLEKGSCRSRGVDVGDFDGDGNLDVLIACEGASPQISLGSGDGRFAPAPAPDVAADAYRLLDVRGDARPELLATTGSSAQLWRYGGSRWKLLQVVRLFNEAGAVSHISLGDINQDGRLDALALSPRGNTLLLNREGRLQRRPPARKLKLPRRGSVAGSFVDYDNDGDLDLHVVPQGLFERETTRFRRTGKLAYGPLPRGPIRSGTVSWADLDGDGLRDPLSARGAGRFLHDQVVDLRLNRRANRSWLQIDLRGPGGNTNAIGAKVRVRGGGKQTAWVGQSDDSAHSSGHHRLYFGLDEARRAKRVVVRWPDGAVTARRDVRINRLIRIPHPDAR